MFMSPSLKPFSRTRARSTKRRLRCTPRKEGTSKAYSEVLVDTHTDTHTLGLRARTRSSRSRSLEFPQGKVGDYDYSDSDIVRFTFRKARSRRVTRSGGTRVQIGNQASKKNTTTQVGCRYHVRKAYLLTGIPSQKHPRTEPNLATVQRGPNAASA